MRLNLNNQKTLMIMRLNLNKAKSSCQAERQALLVSDAQRNFNYNKKFLNGIRQPMSNGYLKISNDGKLVNAGTNNKSGNMEGQNNNMQNYKELNEEDMVALNKWLDQREAELIAEEGYWEEQNYRRQEMEAWKEYSSQNPYEKFDSPDFYFERD